MTDKPKCSRKVPTANKFLHAMCSKLGTEKHDGKWWCAEHNPKPKPKT